MAKMKTYVVISLLLIRETRKSAFCVCENRDADHRCGNRAADQRLRFLYIDSNIPLLSKFLISSLEPSFVVVQPGLCLTWLETSKAGLVATRLI